MPKKHNSRLNLYEKCTYSVVTCTESFFYRLGKKVGESPVKTIAFCWILVGISALGFFRFRQEKNPVKLWVPPQSSFAKDTEWLTKTLQKGLRPEIVILEAENVLNADTLLQLLDIHDEIASVRSENGLTWKDVCFELPDIDPALLKFVASEDLNITSDDPSVNLHPGLYCSIVESMPKKCYERSLLELWNYDREIISNLTEEDVVFKINNHREYEILGHLSDFKGLLGGVKRNETDHIVSASVLQNIWYVSVNFSAVDMDEVGNVAGTASWASVESLEWELAYLEIVSNISRRLPTFLKMYYMSSRSFGDITSKTMFQDVDKLIIGGFIMVIYVQFVISKFNLLEARILLGVVGLLSVAMSFIVGCGICSLFGVPYGPVHTSLPFLLMGLGVDDMFVIMACWDDLSPSQKKLPVAETIGLILKHGGVSITITSVTDVLAFIIGSSTILPSLESYCIYAAVCVLMTFIFATTFFAACFALDQKRIAKKMNGIVPCYRLSNYDTNDCSQKQLSNHALKVIYEKFILRTPVKVLILIFTAVCLGISIECCTRLEQKFDPEWFVPETTYYAKFITIRKKFFPSFGFEGGIYTGNLNYSQEFTNVRRMAETLKQHTDIITDFVDWTESFERFVKLHYYTDLTEEMLDDDHFNLFLSKFLFSPYYAKYQANFQFESPLQCGSGAPKITLSNVGFTFRILKGPEEYIPAMHKVNYLGKNVNFTTGDKFATAWSIAFSTWVTDEVIDIEVIRNLQLALICVMSCTFILIADVQTCFWVFICVLFTMVDVCGFMQMWGLTIDLVSCIGLELAIGLCVDYATHIGHTFLTIDGTRTDRTVKTMQSIGSAVLYGGLSTLIGVFMLSQSEAYTFQTFFKIFLLVILFGLFHGVVFLPVVLSFIGPKPYKKHQVLPQEEVIEIK